ncbi:right-handed parallel beta-helix repeat-containing protein [Rhodobaculum claviforme]|uniref:Right handed beta helix domain-containing protein n=1 Tax=Rhodobaculum claviforme TaxID=1549854 RepID=A0A934TLV4_9RHOB|nr:right-handed parallel beta-helix repeat-containing protein [Rhodobaculum claviforme]MBK5928013.1 hypothetical protein [Rhodobaculum claviforme]
MTFHLCQVTGTLVAPDGSPLPEVQVQFLPAPVSARGVGAQTLAPHPVSVLTDPEARIDVALTPGVYSVRTRAPEGREYPPFLVDVPGGPVATLADILLHLPAPQSVYDAAASARVASKAAADAAGSAAAAGTAGDSATAAATSAAAAEMSAQGIADTAVQVQADRAGATLAAGQAQTAASTAQSQAQTASASAVQSGVHATTATMAAVTAEQAAALAEASNRTFASRAAFEAAQIPADADSWTVLHAGLRLAYRRDAAGTAIESANGTRGAPVGGVRPEHWGAAPGVDCAAQIQAAIDWLEAQGGGELLFAARSYPIAATIRVRRNVWLRGEGWHFEGDFTNSAVITGSLIELQPGANCDLVLFRADPAPGVTVRQRLHGGMRDIGVFGRRSNNFARAAVDLNAAGRGIRMEGVSYVTLDNVCVFRCAEAGVSLGSFDYGGGVGLLSCNNMNWRNVLSTGNAGDGFEIFGGDGTYSQLVAGFNGRHGFRVGDGPLVGCKAWNNAERGFTISSNAGMIGCDSYDNGHCGVHVAAKDVRLIGCEIRTNGTAQLPNARDRAGVFIASGAQDIVIEGNTVDNKPGKTPTQQVGVLCETAGVRIMLGTNVVQDNTLANLAIADLTTAQLHGSVPAGDLRHPGFTATGNIDLDDRVLARAKGMTFSVWGNVTFSNGVLGVGANTVVFANIAAGATVTELTADISRGIPLVIVRNASAAPLIFQHANNRLRLVGGVDRTLARNEAIMFVWVTGSIWQQIG